jgi:quinol monooxygenase YgiN
MSYRRAIALVVLGVFVGSEPTQPRVSAQEPNPIVAKVKESVKDPSKPFTMIVLVKVREGQADAFEKAFVDAIKGTRKEKGNITYQLNRDPKKPTEYMVYERWQNVAALEAHMKTEHIMNLLGALPDLLAGEPEVQVLMPASE